ncbi:MAG: retropepsin-like aspartic protease [Candidatus Acidiferrum sp.]
MSFESDDPFVIVQAWLDNIPVRLAVDTGSSALVLFQNHLTKPITRLSGGTAIATDVGGGDYRLQPVLISDTRLGSQELGPLTVVIVTDQEGDTHDFDGLLSMRGLHLQEISFDFVNHEISWRK